MRNHCNYKNFMKYLWVLPKIILKILADPESIPVILKRIRIILLLQLIKMFLFPANDTPYERVLRITEKKFFLKKYGESTSVEYFLPMFSLVCSLKTCPYSLKMSWGKRWWKSSLSPPPYHLHRSDFRTS